MYRAVDAILIPHLAATKSAPNAFNKNTTLILHSKKLLIVQKSDHPLWAYLPKHMDYAQLCDKGRFCNFTFIEMHIQGLVLKTKS